MIITNCTNKYTPAFAKLDRVVLRDAKRNYREMKDLTPSFYIEFTKKVCTQDAKIDDFLDTAVEIRKYVKSETSRKNYLSLLDFIKNKNKTNYC